MVTIHICIAFNENYAPHAAALIVSIMENRSGQDYPVFHILADKVTDQSKRLLIDQFEQSACEFSFIDVNDDVFWGLPKLRNSYTTYMKLYLGSFLPQDVSKVLYLDCDIVVAASLAPLFNTDIAGKYAAVVAEGDGGTHFQKFTDNCPYFNAGMILLNLDTYRKDGFEASVIKRCVELNDRLTFHDQDVFNHVFAGKVVFLPPCWNVCMSSARMIRRHAAYLKKSGAEHSYTKEELNEAMRSPCIIHFAFGKKPWNFGCFNPMRKLYWKYLKLTPFYKEVQRRYYADFFATVRRWFNPITYFRRIANHYRRKSWRKIN